MAKRKAAGADDAPSTTRRKVRATRTGYYEHTIRHAGDVFMQDDDVSPFSDVWMEKVDDDVPEKITGSNAVIQKEHDTILRQRANLGGDPTGTEPTGEKNPLGA